MWRLAWAVVALAVLAGCAAPTGPKAVSASVHLAPAKAPATTTTTTLPVTPIDWTSCNGNLECGTLVVPLDYADPRRGTIAIALERHLAEDPQSRIGSLVINPGGPGVSGIDDFSNELSVLTAPLLDDFDIVTFDPRGVERSDPVTCGETPGAAPGPLSDPVPQTPTQQKAAITAMRQFGADCEKASGAVLPYIGTVDVARDLERLRVALGDPGLTFMGQSYGTLLGATYAEMYPTHVRAMVLDSAIDPAASIGQITIDQAKGFEGALNSFFTWCASSAQCPWQTSTDPTAAVLALIANSRVSPAPAGGGRTAGPGELYDALLEGLYSQLDWPTLGAALAADAAGNGAPIIAMSDHYVANGSTNGSDAGEAIDCLDHPTSRDTSGFGALAERYAQIAPVFGPLLAWDQAACATWPAKSTRPVGPARAPGSPPILVVGTTNDPATPYAWAVALSHELAQGVLLTRVGNDHVAYFYSSCVRNDVQTYLLGGGAPPAGTTCSS